MRSSFLTIESFFVSPLLIEGWAFCGLVASTFEARREALQRLVAGVDGLLFSEALAAEGAVVFAKACELGLEGNRVATGGQLLSEREESQLAEDQEPEFRQDVTRASLKPSQ